MAYIDIKIPGETKRTQKGVELLLRMGEQIMANLNEFIAAQNARSDRQDAAIARIEEKLNTVLLGGLTSQEEAGLGALQVRTEAITSRLERIAGQGPSTVEGNLTVGGQTTVN